MTEDGQAREGGSERECVFAASVAMRRFAMRLASS